MNSAMLSRRSTKINCLSLYTIGHADNGGVQGGLVYIYFKSLWNSWRFDYPSEFARQMRLPVDQGSYWQERLVLVLRWVMKLYILRQSDVE